MKPSMYREKVVCPTCGGAGTVIDTQRAIPRRLCDQCNGSGSVISKKLVIERSAVVPYTPPKSC